MHLPEGTEENHNKPIVKTVCILAMIETGHVLDASQNCYVLAVLSVLGS
jgi:hypothetical protein